MMMLLVAVPTETFALSKPAQVKNLKASAKTETSITLQWRKVKGAKGYQVQQYNTKTKKWKTVKAVKNLKYKNTKLKANTAYRYRVRAYTSYKQYYNTKTKKWQNKKPAKGNWKAKKTRTKYLFGTPSKVLNVKTKAKTVKKKTCSHNWCSWYVTEEATRTKKGKETRWCSKCRGYEHRYTPVKPKNPFAMPIDSWIGEEDDGYIKGDKIKMTDYKGQTWTFVKTQRNWWEDESGWKSLHLTDRSSLARYCKSIDGTFKDNYYGGTAEFKQKNGVAISIGEIRFSGDDLPGAVMYNGDENKLRIVVKNKIEKVNSYNYDKEPITQEYIMKDGYRLVPYYGIKTKYEEKDGSIIKKLSVFDIDLILHQVSCGFVKGDVVADVIYDGTKLGQIKYTVNKNADASGMTQGRKDYLAVALAAIKANGGPKNYHEDMRAIEAYIKKNYKYGESFGKYSSMTCSGGAAVLETYSIYQYKVYGFFGYGSARPGNSNYGYHVAFHPDTKPKGCSSYDPPNTYFQTQGY
jgi:hypothetical protein